MGIAKGVIGWILSGTVVAIAAADPSLLAAQTSGAGPPLEAAESADRYAFTDDYGRLVHVSRLSDVPAHLRKYAKRLSPPSAAQPSVSDRAKALWASLADEADAASSAPETIFAYRGPSGRRVFTNVAGHVPAAQRAGAALDLSHVSLNSEVGAALRRHFKERFEQLRQTGFCSYARSRLALPLWQRALRDHRPLVIFAGVLLLLLLVTPRMARWVGGAAWAKVLSFATPALGAAGLLAFTLVQSGRAYERLRSRAFACEEGAWQTVSTGPAPLAQQLRLLRALEAESKALEQIRAESL